MGAVLLSFLMAAIMTFPAAFCYCYREKNFFFQPASSLK